jgi:UDP-3-O-[3-hydroxymyristoyl] glucosamine N-acyltransferase
MQRWTLGTLAERLGLQFAGDPQLPIEGVCSLEPGQPGRISFLADPRYRKQLETTRAAAVVLRARDRDICPVAALVVPDPAVAFAAVAGLFDTSREFAAQVHTTAAIAPGAKLGAGVGVGPHAVIEDDVEVGEGCYIGPGCVLRRGSRIGAGSRLEANAYVGERCRLGARALVHAGAVIGGRGFGLAPSPKGWVEVPQVGAVVIGDDVEIGSNTCIDRGALDDTIIEDGVKLDNLIQIAHNCRIGANTAIAGGVGIAGSTTIGRRCMIGGAAGIGGHLRIGDDVVVLGRAMVTKSLPAAGVYGSGLPVMPVREWRKLVARMRRLERYEERLRRLEGKSAPAAENEDEDSDSDES